MSASGDLLAKIWDLTTMKCVATLQGHKEALVKVAWLNAGLQFVSASVDGMVKVWNVKKHICLNTFEMHEEKIWALDFCQKEDSEGSTTTMMLTGGSDSCVKFWRDYTAEKTLEENTAKLEQMAKEQTLSKLMRDNELCDAAVLAFRMNKLRDFFFAMNKLVCGKLVPAKAHIPGLMIAPVLNGETSDALHDPVDSILLSASSRAQAVE